jgi:hypothetical protein
MRCRRAEGVSRDISSKGEFIVSRESPERGASISLEIMLPSSLARIRLLRIEAQGTVVRVEPSTIGERKSGFAVCNQQVAFSKRT